MPQETEDESLGVDQLPQDELEATPAEHSGQPSAEADNKGVEAGSEDATSSERDKQFQHWEVSDEFWNSWCHWYYRCDRLIDRSGHTAQGKSQTHDWSARSQWFDWLRPKTREPDIYLDEDIHSLQRSHLKKLKGEFEREKTN